MLFARTYQHLFLFSHFLKVQFTLLCFSYTLSCLFALCCCACFLLVPSRFLFSPSPILIHAHGKSHGSIHMPPPFCLHAFHQFRALVEHRTPNLISKSCCRSLLKLVPILSVISLRKTEIKNCTPNFRHKILSP